MIYNAYTGWREIITEQQYNPNPQVDPQQNTAINVIHDQLVGNSSHSLIPNNNYANEVKNRCQVNYKELMDIINADNELATGIEAAYKSNPKNFISLIRNLSTNSINDRFIQVMKKGIISNPTWIWG